MKIIFNVGDKIKNRKTGKIGIVAKVIYEHDIIYYHLIGTPNCKHVFFSRDERFDIYTEEDIK